MYTAKAEGSNDVLSRARRWNDSLIQAGRQSNVLSRERRRGDVLSGVGRQSGVGTSKEEQREGTMPTARL